MLIHWNFLGKIFQYFACHSFFFSVLIEKVNFWYSIFQILFRSDLPLRPHNPADVYYRLTRPDIYNNIGMVNENGEKWKELRNQLTPPLSKTPQGNVAQIGQIIDDFMDVLHLQANKSNREIHGFQHQVNNQN